MATRYAWSTRPARREGAGRNSGRSRPRRRSWRRRQASRAAWSAIARVEGGGARTRALRPVRRGRALHVGDGPDALGRPLCAGHPTGILLHALQPGECAPDRVAASRAGHSLPMPRATGHAISWPCQTTRSGNRYLADLEAIFPATRGIVDDVTIARWEFGAPTPGPSAPPSSRPWPPPSGGSPSPGTTCNTPGSTAPCGPVCALPGSSDRDSPPGAGWAMCVKRAGRGSAR